MRRVGALLLVAVLAGMPLLGCSGGTTGGSRQWLYEDLCVELLNRAPGYEGEVTEEVAHSMAKGFFVEEDELAEVPRHDWSLYDVRATAHTESAPGYNGVLSGAGGDRTFGCGTGGGRMPRGAFSDVVCIVTKPTSAHADTVRGGTGTSLRQ